MSTIDKVRSRPCCFAAVLLLGVILGLAPSLASAAPGGGGSGGGSGSGGSGGNGGNGGGGNGSGNGGGNGGGAKTDLTTCPTGEVWNTSKHKCLKAHSGIMPDDALSDYAFALAKADRYAEALVVLDLLQNTKTPKALNYRGYVTRKLGRTEEGIGYYLQSVALDPTYVQVREYLGEAYVIQGKVDLAKEQLDRIRSLSGTQSEEYEDLARAIETGKV